MARWHRLIDLTFTIVVLLSSGAGIVAAPPTPAADPAVAKVNGAEIPASRLDQRVGLAVSRAGRSGAEASATQVEALRKQVLEDLVDEELLYQSSVQEGIRVTDKVVDERLQALEARFPTREEYLRSLSEQGIEPEKAREQMRRNLAIEELVKQRVDAGIQVSEAEVSDYYQKNKARFRQEEAVRVREIFVRLDQRSDAEAKAKARQALESLRMEIRGGQDFAGLARQYSQGETAGEGGELGWLTTGGTKPVLARAALPLGVGEVSDIIETPGGLHLLKVEEKKPAGDVSLERAHARIESLLIKEKQSNALKDYLGRLKSAARIEILSVTP